MAHENTELEGAPGRKAGETPGTDAHSLVLNRMQRILRRIPEEHLRRIEDLDDLGLAAGIEEWLITKAAADSALGRAERRGLEARRRLLRSTDLQSVDQVAEELGIKPESVVRRIRRNALLAIPNGREQLVPAFQIREGEILPGLPECLQALQALGPLTRLDWFMSPHPDLNEESPAEVLPRDRESVVALARRTGKQGGV